MVPRNSNFVSLKYFNLFVLFMWSAFTVSWIQRQNNPCTCLDGPGVFRRLRLPDFKEIGTKNVNLSVLCTGRLYIPGNIPDSYFC